MVPPVSWVLKIIPVQKERIRVEVYQNTLDIGHWTLDVRR